MKELSLESPRNDYLDSGIKSKDLSKDIDFEHANVKPKFNTMYNNFSNLNNNKD